MSKEQPRREDEEVINGEEESINLDPIKYGDVFQVSGEVADKAVAPQDAATMKSAETAAMGQVQPGGVAHTMHMAATLNQQAGLLSGDDVTRPAVDQAFSVTGTQLSGRRIITESVGGQVVGQFVQQAQITIGQALEASTQSSGDKVVEQSDAAAIRAAVVRATGTNMVTPGGLAAIAESAATFNATVTADEDKVKLNDVLSGATTRLTADKVATSEDAKGVMRAELRNKPYMTAHPGGVSASVAVAANMNEGTTLSPRFSSSLSF